MKKKVFFRDFVPFVGYLVLFDGGLVQFDGSPKKKYGRKTRITRKKDTNSIYNPIYLAYYSVKKINADRPSKCVHIFYLGIRWATTVQ